MIWAFGMGVLVGVVGTLIVGGIVVLVRVLRDHDEARPTGEWRGHLGRPPFQE